MRAMTRNTRGLAALAMGMLCALGVAQDLSLDQALKLARERNGDIRRSFENVKAARERTNQSYAAFLPTLTPSATYTSNRREIDVNTGPRFSQTEGLTTEIEARWKILDSGERNLNYQQSRRSAESTAAQSLGTLRNILVNVHESYLEALRSQDLLRLSKVQEARTDLILEQAKARVEVKAAAAISVMQALADAENARVNSLESQNKVVTSEASLKAIIGWDRNEDLPKLSSFPEPTNFADAGDLNRLTEMGLRDRADLTAERKQLEATRARQLLAERQAFGSLSLDVSFTQQLTPVSLENRAAGLFLSLPLFDGGERRAAYREAKANFEGGKATLAQSERVARQEIESQVKGYQLNVRRVQAARTALDAARRNYEAAVESQKVGVYDIIQVSTAQVSLVTAESNYINAIYDYYINDVRLKLATGQMIPGEV